MLHMWSMVQSFCHTLHLVPVRVSSSSFINSLMGQYFTVWVTGNVTK